MDVFSTISDECYCLHAGVRKSSVTSKLAQALHGVLEWIYHGNEVLLVNLTWKRGNCKNSTYKIASNSVPSTSKLAIKTHKMLRQNHEISNLAEDWTTNLTDYFFSCFEGHLDNVLVLVGGSQVKDAEYVLPTRLDVTGLGVDHVSDAAHHHVFDPQWPVPANRDLLTT